MSDFIACKTDDGYHAKVVLDSVAPSGVRLLTMECRYPRFIHSEMLTHRAFSRNSASSRAIPLAKMLQQVVDDPVTPIRWGSEAKGMQQGAELDAELAVNCCESWLRARDDAVVQAKVMASIGLHKSLCNRVVEPWMWMTCLITSTDWANFFRLRCHPDAEPHMQRIAYIMREAHEASTPRRVATGDWHLPLVTGVDEEMLRYELDHPDCSKFFPESMYGGHLTPCSTNEMLQMISVGRCARVSYLTHDGVRDWRKDVDLYGKLMQGSGFGHWSPLEHVAKADSATATTRSGNFRGWSQYRKLYFDRECARDPQG